MKIRALILSAVFSLVIVSCGDSMKWNNTNDPNADIYGKCEEGSYKCYGKDGDYTSLVCKKGKWEKYEECNYNCNSDTGKCETKKNDSDSDSVPDTSAYTESHRVSVQLAWKQGFAKKGESSVKDGANVDLDLHLVKMTSLEAAQYSFQRKAGLLGTSYRPEYMDSDCPLELTECEKYWRHDDCAFNDNGLEGVADGRTIQWNAKFIFDNSWGGGGNYENPETIVMGPVADEDGDGLPDKEIMDDQYLIVVTYGSCESNYSDGYDRCGKAYEGDDGVYEVDARVSIFVDGEEVPRAAAGDRPADHYYTTTKDFKIKLNEWKVVALIKWDGSLAGPELKPEYSGNAIVTDVAMYEYGIISDPVRHPVCVFDTSDAVLIPVWDPTTYRNYIEFPRENSERSIGQCYDPEEPDPITGDKRKKNCEGLPEDAEWNTASKITQEYDGEKWQPSLQGTYNEEASTTECRFKCKVNYTWNAGSSICVADTRPAYCQGLPANAEWNTVSEITQTWNGTAWYPPFEGSYSNSSSTERCYFKCKEHYEWDGSSCQPEERWADCPAKPANSIWNDNEQEGTYFQTWDGEFEEWEPQYSESAYNKNNGDCRFICDYGYIWNNGGNCVENPCILPDNPCLDVANSNGNCTVTVNEDDVSGIIQVTGYECGCKSDYIWNGNACALRAKILPECSSASAFPCKDSSTGLIWAQKESEKMDWQNAYFICGNDYNSSNYGGFGAGWRLPTISELRTLIKECNGTKMPDGTCGVRDDDVVCLTESDDCWEENCYSCSDGEHSKFGDNTWFWSSSPVTGGDDSKAWGVGFNGAEVDANVKTANKNFRCVKPICASGDVWDAESETCYVPIECEPNTCFKTHTCSGTSGFGFEMSATVEGHGTCNNMNGSCECEQGWLTATSSSGSGTTVQCGTMFGDIFETLNNVECTICDKNNPPSEYATSGCPQEKTGDTSLCSNLSSPFCGPYGTCYYEPTGGHQLYCVCESGYRIDNGDKYTGSCVEDI